MLLFFIVLGLSCFTWKSLRRVYETLIRTFLASAVCARPQAINQEDSVVSPSHTHSSVYFLWAPNVVDFCVCARVLLHLHRDDLHRKSNFNLAVETFVLNSKMEKFSPLNHLSRVFDNSENLNYLLVKRAISWKETWEKTFSKQLQTKILFINVNMANSPRVAVEKVKQLV